MQGLINFAQLCALSIAILLPTALYMLALSFFMFAGWGLWQQSQPQNPFRGKPWIPLVALLLSGLCASFPTFLTKVMTSEGSSIVIGVSSDLTSYDTSPDTSGVLGSTAGDTLVNLVVIFQHFFQTLGAMFCLLAVLGWWNSVSGQTNRSRGGCAIQFVFGTALINILPVAQTLVGVFTA